MTKYYCDHCGKEIELSEALKFRVVCRKVGYYGFDVDILLHENCVAEALGKHNYETLLAVKKQSDEKKKERQKAKENKQ